MYTTLEARLLHVFRQRVAEGPLHFIKGGPSGSNKAHSLCCLNGGPKILRGPCRTMIEAQIYIIVSAYTTPKAFWFKGGNSPFAFSIEGLNF